MASLEWQWPRQIFAGEDQFKCKVAAGDIATVVFATVGVHPYNIMRQCYDFLSFCANYARRNFMFSHHLHRNNVIQTQ